MHKSTDAGEIEVRGSYSDCANSAAVEVAHKETALERRPLDTQEQPQMMVMLCIDLPQGVYITFLGRSFIHRTASS